MIRFGLLTAGVFALPHGWRCKRESFLPSSLDCSLSAQAELPTRTVFNTAPVGSEQGTHGLTAVVGNEKDQKRGPCSEPCWSLPGGGGGGVGSPRSAGSSRGYGQAMGSAGNDVWAKRILAQAGFWALAPHVLHLQACFPRLHERRY